MITLEKKIIISFVLTGIIAILSVGLPGYFVARSRLRKLTFDHLTALREAKKEEIERYFTLLSNQCLTISETMIAQESMISFQKAFYDLEKQASPEEYDGYVKSLTNFYNNDFLPSYNRTATVKKTVVDVFPTNKNTIILQALFIAQNPNPINKKQEYIQSPVKNGYSAAHALYQPFFNRFMKRFGYQDVYLVDTTTGDIVYTTGKLVDIGRNFLTDPFLQNTAVAEVFREMQQSTDPFFVKLVDYDFYGPSYNMPTAFIGTPIFKEEKKVGALIFGLPIDTINKIMTYNEQWADVGLGETGEIFLIGNDRRMRTNSRFFIDDKTAYLEMIERLGFNTSIIDKIRIFNTTILLQEIDTSASRELARGLSDTKEIIDYRGLQVLASFAPLTIKDLSWGIIAKIETKEAFIPIAALSLTMLICSIFLLLFLFIFGYVFVKILTRTYKALIAALEKIHPSQEIVTLQKLPTSTDEFGVIAHQVNIIFDILKNIIQTFFTKQRILGTIIAQTTQSNTALEEHKKELGLQAHHARDSLEQTKKKITTLSSACDVVVMQTKDIFTDLDALQDFLPELQETVTTMYKIRELLEKSIDDMPDAEKESFLPLTKQALAIDELAKEVETIQQKIKHLEKTITTLLNHQRTVQHDTEIISGELEQNTVYVNGIIHETEQLLVISQTFESHLEKLRSLEQELITVKNTIKI
jgi:hypothetical protein